MKAIRNSVHLMGNLGKEVELRTFSTGMKKHLPPWQPPNFIKNWLKHPMAQPDGAKTAENMGSNCQKVIQ